MSLKLALILPSLNLEDLLKELECMLIANSLFLSWVKMCFRLDPYYTHLPFPHTKGKAGIVEGHGICISRIFQKPFEH